MGWKRSEVPDLSGRVIVVTGANSGLGLHSAKTFVAHGAHVVMACRDKTRAAAALAQVCAAGSGSAEVMVLNLADLTSVAEFAQELAGAYPAVDALVNNAGVMGGPRQSTAQGFELQMGTNYIGHFVLTAQVWPLLLAAKAPRVISLSSLAARNGILNADMDAQLLIDPQPYSAMTVYSNTKQATLLFSQELCRRAGAAAADVASIAVHPGVSATNLFTRPMQDAHLGALAPAINGLGRVLLQSPAASAQSEIRAVTDPTIKAGDFVGPNTMGQSRGAPEVLGLYRTGADRATAARLWTLTQTITDVTFPI